MYFPLVLLVENPWIDPCYLAYFMIGKKLDGKDINFDIINYIQYVGWFRVWDHLDLPRFTRHDEWSIVQNTICLCV